ncbi:hypothetical protein BLA29_001550 [Euroglyphus maynei]|uniref:C2H2-type domain-containing protein n=1 Tax=Euroglyphus maynei TaxID=6958 RepID=A0A1Y3AMH5_EURMA|nr:hypothetical protein BLA29_001550 [Euroglyphus maynei]
MANVNFQQQPQTSNSHQIIYVQQPQTTEQQQATTTVHIAAETIQEFANNQFASFVQTPQQHTDQSVTCMQREIEQLKKQNLELKNEIDKLRQAYTDCQYRAMTDNVKISNYLEQIQQLQKEKLDEQPFCHKNSEDQSQYCDECNFEIKSQVALFIHKLNHCFVNRSGIPRHLQLSTRSFSTTPDDSIRFKYRCHQCEIDSEREFQRHEIYMHIYQFHTFDVPYKCKFCFLYFTSNAYLNDHLAEKHSVPNNSNDTGRSNSKNRRTRKENKIAATATISIPTISNTDCPNSTLSLTALSEPLNKSFSRPTKRSRTDNQKPASISEIFQQLVGETTDLNDNNNRSESSSSSTSEASKALESMKRDANIQQIMADLDSDKSLNCKYPGCNFSATTKSHLKFHISAHLMSKYKCPYCTFVANRLVEIKRHIVKATKHANLHVYLCTGCDFATDCEKTFRDHYVRSHDSTADVTDVIERMFLNESNEMIGQTISSAQQTSSDDLPKENDNN